MRFIQKLGTRPQQHQLLWVYLLSEIMNGTTDFHVSEMCTRFNMSKTTLRRAIEWGALELSDMKFALDIQYNNNKVTITKSQNTPAQSVATVEIAQVVDEPKKPKRKSKDVNAFAMSVMGDIEEIIDYLNEKSGKRYKAESKNALKFCSARLKEGYEIDDFKWVIDVKVAKWMGTSMEDYLRPETLFGSKFEAYLNEKPQLNEQQQRFANTQNAVDQAKNFDFFGSAQS